MKDWMRTVFTDGSRYFVSNPLPKKGETITLWLRICEWSPVKQILLRTVKNGEEAMIPLEWSYSRQGLAYFSASVTIWEDVFHYQFYLVTDERVYYYNQKGISGDVLDEVYDFKILTDYQQPAWVKEGVFYQIFPDRFCNGNQYNDVESGEYSFDGYPSVRVKEWDRIPSGYWDSHCLDFYGGDLDGVIRKIPYLKKLGIDGVYLNPVFSAATVHKYDCLDYFHVDPHLGGDRALARLCHALHLNDMKVILDISINHTGTEHRWFNKDGSFFSLEEGAYHNPKAKEREYYFFREDGTMATGWITNNGSRFYMGDDGAMVTNAWVDEGSQRHYVGADGKEQTGWITVNGKQYFLNEEGILADSGWMKQGDKWYFIDTDGSSKTGLFQSEGKWYYLTADGKLQEGWVESQGKRYYLANGQLMTGWRKIGDKQYYFNGDGTMATGWITIDGKSYFLKEDGSLDTAAMKEKTPAKAGQ